MSGTPREYLELQRTGGAYNFSQYTAGSTYGGTNVRTSFTRVRLDPVTLLIDTSDRRFATSEGVIHHDLDRVSSMPYGTAMNCELGTNAGIANIDLTGTPFVVASTFYPGGNVPSGTSQFGATGQTVDLSVYGYCAWNSADPSAYNPYNGAGGSVLQLAYGRE